MDRLRTSLCDLLGVQYPILQSGMGGVAGPELVAEVSRAGGLGILAALRLTGDQLRTGIRRVRELTDRPFGVNLWLHSEVRPPVDPATLAEDTVRRVQGALNAFRDRLGLPATTAVLRCAVGSWGGRRPSLGGCVTGTGATSGATAAGGR